MGVGAVLQPVQFGEQAVGASHGRCQSPRSAVGHEGQAAGADDVEGAVPGGFVEEESGEDDAGGGAGECRQSGCGGA